MDKYEKYLYYSIVPLIAFMSAVLFSEVPIYIRVCAIFGVAFYGFVLYNIDSYKPNSDELHAQAGYKIAFKFICSFFAGIVLNCVMKNCF